MDSDAATLLIAALSLVLAALSLGWQVAQWLLSGGRAKATLMRGVWQGSGAYVGPVTKSGTFELEQFRRQGIDGPAVVGIQVTNRGGALVMVENVAMCPRGGVMRFVPVGERLGPDLPYRLEPGSNASWYMTADHATRLAESSRKVLHENVTGVDMTAHLGTGKTIKTPETLRA
jgi:hypothetical protein